METMERTKYMDATEVAKLVRRSLKEAFPGVKFSVRGKSYSGGSSITVRWTDGPSEPEVRAVVERFEGGYVDGMTDYKGGYVHSLNGERVDFLCDFIFTERKYSDEVYTAALDHVWEYWNGKGEKPYLKHLKDGYSFLNRNPYIKPAGANLHYLIQRELRNKSLGDYPGADAVTLKPRVIEKF